FCNGVSAAAKHPVATSEVTFAGSGGGDPDDTSNTVALYASDWDAENAVQEVRSGGWYQDGCFGMVSNQTVLWHFANMDSKAEPRLLAAAEELRRLGELN